MTKIVLRIASPAKRFFKGLASHWSVYGTSLGSAFACVALIGTVGIFVLPKPGAELVRASYEEPAGTTSPDIVAQTELTQPLGSSGASEFSSFDSGDPSIWGTSSNPKFDLKPNASSCIGLATCGQPSSQVGQKTFMENSAVAAISTGNIQAIDFRDQRGFVIPTGKTFMILNRAEAADPTWMKLRYGDKEGFALRSSNYRLRPPQIPAIASVPASRG